MEPILRCRPENVEGFSGLSSIARALAATSPPCYETAVRRLLPLLLVLVACDRRVAGGSTDGREVFAQACARCHGEGGRPTVQMASQLGVVDLTSPAFRARRTPEGIVTQVRNGSANGRMPAFASVMTEPQIEAVTAYVMALAPAP